jgi:hypothetical protein
VAVARVRYNTSANDTTFLRSLAQPLGGTAAAGNLLIGAWAVDKNAGTFTPPTGWTTVAAQTGTSVSLLIARKVAAGGETTATASWTAGANAGASAVIAEYSGTSTTDPMGPVHLPSYSDTPRTSMVLDPGPAEAAGAALAFFAMDSPTAMGDASDFHPTATGFTWVATSVHGTNLGTPMAAFAEDITISSGEDVAATTFSWTRSDQVIGCMVLINDVTAVSLNLDRLRIGDAIPSAIRVGDSTVSAVYVGDSKVWP